MVEYISLVKNPRKVIGITADIIRVIERVMIAKMTQICIDRE